MGAQTDRCGCYQDSYVLGLPLVRDRQPERRGENIYHAGFHLLYHLASEDRIGGITFSPDLRRLHDTRGYYASAWEPTALVKWATEQAVF
jgi:hypothetical protein